MIAYLFAAGVQTLCYALSRRKSYPLQRWPRPLQFLHRLLYSTITTYRECLPFGLTRRDCLIVWHSAIVVTVIFWALLSNSSTFKTRYSGMYAESTV